jgi:site-specific recombinase XerD
MASWAGDRRRRRNAMEIETLAIAPQRTERRARTRQRGVFEKIPGSGTWWIRYVDSQGRFRREKAGTKGNAKDLYTKRKNEALAGRKLPEKLRRRAVSFGEIADDAIAYVKGRYSRPADDVARLELLKEHFPGAADAITPAKIKLVLSTLAAQKQWSASTTNHHHNMISVAFRIGIENEKAESNPARAVRRQKEDNNRIRFLKPDEEKKLRDTLRSTPEWAEHEPEFDLAMHTGLRRSSMYRYLLWENVDLTARVAIIPKTKNGDQVVVPLNDVAMRALSVFRSRGDGTGRVVRNAAGETLNVNAHWFIPAVRAAGIKNFKWHDCRHHYASMLRQTGTPLGNIAELLGHKGLADTLTCRSATCTKQWPGSKSQNQLTPLLTPTPGSSLPTRTKSHRITRGGERGPVTFPAFKAGDAVLRGPSGGFDFHTLPPYCLV